jgi:penicillin-binding protein 2
MRQDIDRRKRFTRRALVLGGLQIAALGGLVGRLYNLQVVEAQRYQVLAEENRINVRLLPPPRGLIFDRFGQGLAVNRQTFRLVLVSEQTDSVSATLDRIAALIALSDRDIRRVLKETSRRRGFVPVTVRDDLSWTEVTENAGASPTGTEMLPLIVGRRPAAAR